ncbi:S-adenosyl-L-methionine-dependent methyltransferase [Schizophyllum amplum]|uniref:S-adenosyl-L-methionine-dependent methyltransferase n=1 Tax=Schizophyllum amplum TaxID=97359 RepID=A0A550CYY7_9AGAR|nr:S-adenosyl-L-methionine-dependent methyltransferase [Auriculariopsis ampla]
MAILDFLENKAYDLLDRGLVPDAIVRAAIRTLCRQRLREIGDGGGSWLDVVLGGKSTFAEKHAAKTAWIEGVKQRTTIADHTDKANEQHYEVPTEFILSTLGPAGKYSSCWYPTGKETLEEAEILILNSYCEKAQLRDGQEVLDLGCGWGSLSLFIAARYPHSKVVGLSNSTTQKVFIDETAKGRGLDNVEIITADVNTFDFAGQRHFDRILSIEMFEHMKNYEVLLAKVSSWMRPCNNADNTDDMSSVPGMYPSLLFIHIFCHRDTPYHFEEGDGWMAKHFFSGGTMPSQDLLLYFQTHITLERSWYLPGTHYAHTLEDWLRLQDSKKKEGLAILRAAAVAQGQDPIEGDKTFHRFRVFYMACAELFAMDNGQRWGVGSYLFRRK